MPENEFGLTPPEIQMVVSTALSQREEQKTSIQALRAFGEQYFGAFLADWGEAARTLREKGWLKRTRHGYILTDVYKPIAAELILQHPKYQYFYEEFYQRAENSSVHAEFCERVYGKNLCQHGMMDMPQLERLIEVMGLPEAARGRRRHHLLELGCGSGRVAEYISDTTGVRVTGVDSSQSGVQLALNRTRPKRTRLAFFQDDVRTVQIEPGRFKSIIAVDVVYFLRDIDRFICNIKTILQNGGLLGVYYSCWAAPDEPKEKLLPEGNPFALALQRSGLEYEYWDFSEQEAHHWRLKLKTLKEMQAAFTQEGNRFLYERRMVETEAHQQFVDAGCVRRYLYRVVVPA
jgi:SAM-dependent methyltransferase